MRIKQLFQLAGLAGLVVLAACGGPIGPANECTLDQDDYNAVCTTAQGQPAPVDKIAR